MEGILAQFVLTVAVGHSLLAGGEIVPPEEVEEVSLPQVRDLVGEAFFVDQQGEGDLRLLAEESGVVGVPKTDCGEGCPGFLNLQLMIAQLRDMLAAEDSSIVAQEDEHRGSFFPQGSEANCLAVWVREFNGGEGGGGGGIRHRLVPTTALREQTPILPLGGRGCNAGLTAHAGARLAVQRGRWLVELCRMLSRLR